MERKRMAVFVHHCSTRLNKASSSSLSTAFFNRELTSANKSAHSVLICTEVDSYTTPVRGQRQS